MNTNAKITSAIATVGLAAVLMIAPAAAEATQPTPTPTHAVSTTDQGSTTGQVASTTSEGRPDDHVPSFEELEEDLRVGEPEEAANPHLLGGPTAPQPARQAPVGRAPVGHAPAKAAPTQKTAPKSAPKTTLPRVAG